MPTIVATYGGRDDNAFTTLASAHTIVTTTRLNHDSWILANTAQREIALIQAASEITHQRWSGRKFFYFQKLAFPRIPENADFPYGAYGGPNPPQSFFNYIAFDEYQRLMRERVETANAYQALHVLRTCGENAHRIEQFDGVGGWSRGYRFSESRSYREPSNVLHPSVWDELHYYKGSLRISRGGSPGAPIDNYSTE